MTIVTSHFAWKIPDNTGKLLKTPENSGKLHSVFKLTGFLKRRFKTTQGARRFEILSRRYTNNACFENSCTCP